MLRLISFSLLEVFSRESGALPSNHVHQPLAACAKCVCVRARSVDARGYVEKPENKLKIYGNRKSE